MAESVKRNARKRKPPSHLLHDIYSPEQLESSLNPNLLIRDQGRTNHESFSTTYYARLLLKFTNKTNKAFRESMAGKDQKEKSKGLEKAPPKQHGGQSRTENIPRYERPSLGPQSSDRNPERMGGAAGSQKFQNKQPKQIPTGPQGLLQHSNRQTRSQEQHNFRDNVNFQGLPEASLQLSRITQEQFHKFRSQGINPAFFQQQLNINLPGMQNPQPPQQNRIFGQHRDFERDDVKLFKRASYHVGLAYYIHVEKIKRQTEPKIEDFDPTYVSRKLRQANEKQYELKQFQMLEGNQKENTERRKRQNEQKRRNQQRNEPNLQQQQQQQMLMKMQLEMQQQAFEHERRRQEEKLLQSQLETHRRNHNGQLDLKKNHMNGERAEEAIVISGEFEEPQFEEIQLPKQGQAKNSEANNQIQDQNSQMLDENNGEANQKVGNGEMKE